MQVLDRRAALASVPLLRPGLGTFAWRCGPILLRARGRRVSGMSRVEAGGGR